MKSTGADLGEEGTYVEPFRFKGSLGGWSQAAAFEDANALMVAFARALQALPSREQLLALARHLEAVAARVDLEARVGREGQQ